MGLLTKQYLRYIPGSVFGIIGFGDSIHFITKYGQQGKFVAVPACEEVFIWDLRRKVKILTLKCEDVSGTVTLIEPRPPLKGSFDHTHIAVGYSEGTLVLYDFKDGQSIQFNGHRGGISALAWDPEGMRVASGSQDGEIVIWDMVSERGIVRLRGHKGRINRVRFLESRNVIISCAKDWYIKFWDLDTNHCFCTLAKHHTEAWDFAFLRDDTRLVVGGAGSEMNVFSVDFINQFKIESGDEKPKKEEEDNGEPLSKMKVIDTEADEELISAEQDHLEENPYVRVKRMGSIMRSKTDRVSGLVTDGRVIAAYSKSLLVDLFVIRTEEEVQKKKEKRIKKSKKRAREANSETQEEQNETMLADEIFKLPSFKATNKVKGVSLLSAADDTIQISTLHADNSLTVYETSIMASGKKNKEEVEDICAPVRVLSNAGHRMEVRNVVFNTLCDQIISASGDSIKVWHRHDCQVVRTIECNSPLSILLPPGDRHVVVGTRTGRLQLYDLATGSILEDFEAHDASEKDSETGVWALALMHDGRGFVSGGSDCMVKFWNFELVEDVNIGRGKRLSFVQDSKALRVADQITTLRCSDSGKFLAAATLDLKETLFYTDTLKLVHEFYGKSMPSTCMDFSSDSTMIVTGSYDSCIRIFATDFGDEKKMLKNCHQGGVTEVRFVPNTHMFFSCGHDSTVKQWDADNFQRIITLKGHSGIVRCLAVSHNGSFVVSCGQDRSLRLWERSKEPLVLGDEREEERMNSQEGAFQRPVLAEEKDALAVRASKMSKETEKAADQLLEALSIYRQQKEAGEEAVPNQVMTLVYKTEDPLKFVLLVLRKIKSSELEEAIIVLPLNMVLVLLVCLKGILEKEWDVELATRVLVVAVRINLQQLLMSKDAFAIIRALSRILPHKTQALQDMVGFNLAGLRHMQHRMEERNETKLFVEAAMKEKDKRKRSKKKARIIKRAVLTI